MHECLSRSEFNQVFQFRVPLPMFLFILHIFANVIGDIAVGSVDAKMSASRFINPFFTSRKYPVQTLRGISVPI